MVTLSPRSVLLGRELIAARVTQVQDLLTSKTCSFKLWGLRMQERLWNENGQGERVIYIIFFSFQDVSLE